jgi:D-aminopeptidase
VIDGVPVGRAITDVMPDIAAEPGSQLHEGSVIVVIATDAPLSSVQLSRLARRAGLGLARTGSISANTSGDIIIAFSTANTIPLAPTEALLRVTLLATDVMDPLFQAVIEATEEAVLNALCAGRTMQGVRGNVVYELPYDRLARAFADRAAQLARLAPQPSR